MLWTEKMIQKMINVFKDVLIAYLSMRTTQTVDPSNNIFNSARITYFLQAWVAQQLKINHEYTTIKRWLDTNLPQIRALYISVFNIFIILFSNSGCCTNIFQI